MTRITPVFAFALAAMLAPALGAPAALAAGGGGSSMESSTPAAKPVDPNFTQGKAAIDKRDWGAAITSFQAVVAKDPKNADAFNWIGYAQRNQGNYEAAFASYGKALEIDPRHRGAHEYVGEAYLKQGNIAKAEEHLKQLDRICTFGCAEYTELKNKVAAAKAGKPS